MYEERAFIELGYSSVHQYAEVELDLSARQTGDLLRIARALPDLPHLREAFEAGRVGWTKARELVRVATGETDAAWTERALSATSRELERQVAACREGEPPPASEDVPLRPARVRMTFTLESADAQVLTRALKVLRRRLETGSDEDDDGALLAEMARRVLAEPVESSGETAASDQPVPPERHRVVLELCPRCQGARAGEHAVSEEVLGEATCDAEVVDLRPGPGQGRLTHQVPPARRRAVLHGHGTRCAVPYCRSTLWLDVHHILPRVAGGTHDLANLVPLCSLHHRLVHEGRVQVARDERGRIICVHADGRHFGPLHGADPEPPTRPELATPARAALAEEPLTVGGLAGRLRVPVHRAVNLLESLCWHGEVLRLEDGRFVAASAVGPKEVSEGPGGRTTCAPLSAAS